MSLITNPKNPLHTGKRKLFISGLEKLNCFLFILIMGGVSLCSQQASAQGSWTLLNNFSPDYNAGVMLLLSDGTVMVKSYPEDTTFGTGVWDRLTPDSSGSYINGTWSQDISNMHDSRLYFSSRILKDGRVYIAGGEYGTGKAKAEVYDPIANTWTSTPAPNHTISDANSEILSDGRILNALVESNTKGTLIYNPATNTWTNGPQCVGSHAEACWVKLRDNSILFADNYTLGSERYIPAQNKWIADANVPVNLYDPFAYETGAGFLLPDGRAFFLGSSGHTAYYTPTDSTTPGSWVAGPDIPLGLGTPDASAAMMPNGKILCAVSSTPTSFDQFPSPTYYYEFDYLTNTFTKVTTPLGFSAEGISSYVTNMLVLPDGSILYSEQGDIAYYVYTPDGTPLAAGKPIINSIIQNSCSSYTITGTQFNGISEGAAYGDDWQMATNYPLVRLTNGTNVYYARTANWNSTGVQRGLLPDTAQFTLPAGFSIGTYSLEVIANGISSDPVTFSPTALLSSTLTPPSLCSKTLFTYAPTSDSSNATLTWTRAAVSGITNTAITTPQTANPNEVLINASTTAKHVNYLYSINLNGCSALQTVSVIVNPLPSLNLTGLRNDTLCESLANKDTLSGHPSTGTFSGNGMTGKVFDPVAAGPGWSVITYSYTDNNGCGNTLSDSVFVDVCTGLNDLRNEVSSFAVYPNPAHDLLYIKDIAVGNENYNLILTDIIGRTLHVWEMKAKNASEETILNLTDLPEGLYFLIVSSDKVKQVFKIERQ